MRTLAAVSLVCVLLGGCPRGAGEWALVQPPEVADAGLPRGYRLVTQAPLAEWHRTASFATEQACEEARRAETDRSIDRARAAHVNDAKNELPVRRAVNARCVPAADVGAPR